MSNALKYATMLGVPIISHAEDPSSARAAMHAGYWSTRLGLAGMPPAGEEPAVYRDIALARPARAPARGARLDQGRHRPHRPAKADGRRGHGRGPRRTTSLTDDAHCGLLLEPQDEPAVAHRGRRGALEGLADGTIDCIATDHAPHTATEKELQFDKAPFGVIGLSTSFAVAHTQLVASGRLPLPELVRRMSLAPAQRFGLAGGKLEAGQPANLAILDPQARWQVRAEDLGSRARNSPFLGRTLRGRVAGTIYHGRLVHRLQSDTRTAAVVG